MCYNYSIVDIKGVDSMFLITDTISSFLINIISSDIYQDKQNFFQRIRIRSFKKKLNREIESYLLSCDGTILVTGSFQEYFANNHICDKMFENIVGTILLEIWYVYFLPICILGYNYSLKS